MLYLLGITGLLVIVAYPVLYEQYQNYKLKKAGKLWIPPKGAVVMVWGMFAAFIMAAWMIWQIPAIYPEYPTSTNMYSIYGYGIGGEMQISSLSNVNRVDDLEDYLSQKDYDQVICDRLVVYTSVENHKAEIIAVGDFEYKKGNRSVLHLSPTRHIEKSYDYSVDEKGILLRMEFACYEEERNPIIIIFREKTLNGYLDYKYEFQDIKDGEKLNLELVQSQVEQTVNLLPVDELIREKDDFSDIEVGITLDFYNGSEFVLEAADIDGNRVNPEDILIVEMKYAYSHHSRGNDQNYRVTFSRGADLYSYAMVSEEGIVEDKEKKQIVLGVLTERDLNEFPEDYNSLTQTVGYYHVPQQQQKEVINEIIENGTVTMSFINTQTKDKRVVIIGMKQIVTGNYKGIWMK